KDVSWVQRGLRGRFLVGFLDIPNVVNEVWDKGVGDGSSPSTVSIANRHLQKEGPCHGCHRDLAQELRRVGLEAQVVDYLLSPRLVGHQDGIGMKNRVARNWGDIRAAGYRLGWSYQK